MLAPPSHDANQGQDSGRVKLTAWHRTIFDRRPSQVYRLGLPEAVTTATADNAQRSVRVYASISDNGQNQLDISYLLLGNPHLPIAWLDLSKHLTTPLQRGDYLWLDNCLECFLAGIGTGYYEINVGANARFAVYRFEDYRTPNTMPPPACDDIEVQWQYCQLTQADDLHPAEVYAAIRLILKPQALAHLQGLPSVVNPTVILYRDNQPAFYAPKHPAPPSEPDFHQRQYWQVVHHSQ